MRNLALWIITASGIGAGALLISAARSSGVDADPVQALGLVPSFSDEFDGDRLDPKKWSSGTAAEPIEQRSLFNNGERQIYFDPSFMGLGVQPISVSGGVLTISAEPMTPAIRSVVRAAVSALPADKANSALKDTAYSSGRISTAGRFSQAFGYFEMRARFPEGKGLWPAFWLLPADGSWPPEIDVIEVIGQEPATAVLSVHIPGGAHTIKAAIPATADGFHRFGALWTPQTVDYYIDGKKVASHPAPAADKRMFMVANLAVGGNWPGDPDANTRFPAIMDIDYIRAWRFKQKPTR